jgi:Ser/Thr protein kinase RdoA (MazF antagonist)
MYVMSLERETFSAEELGTCLSHYDLGVIEAIKEFPRGSRRSPKVVITAQRGRFLFKRRARGKDDLTKVAFTHQLQLHLAAENFPLPHLIGTRPDNNSMLVWKERIYEMFEFIEAGPYDGSRQATHDAGRILGLYHKLLANFCSDYLPPKGSYHDAAAVGEAIGNTVSSLPLEGRPEPGVLSQTVANLQKAYRQCADRANEQGLNDWPLQIVHADWHPGNMLFRGKLVAGVIDYDSARLQPRAVDLANGALQFSILGGSEDPSEWPAQVDVKRMKSFLSGYDSANVISRAELQVLPHLMCEAMIAESVLPIAATGSFGRMEGFPFMQMVERKVQWVLEHAEELSGMLKD